MKLIKVINSSEQPLLEFKFKAAMENVRVASERNSPRRKSDMSPREDTTSMQARKIIAC